MRWTDNQRILLAGATILFVLQWLPHWWTGLLGSLFWDMTYSMLAVALFLLSLVAALYALVAWLIEKNPTVRVQKRQWFFTFGLISVIAVACTAASVAYARGLPMGSFAKSFDKNVWADPNSSEYTEGDITPCQKMLGDVIGSIVRNGVRDEIIAQLGPPIVGRLPGTDVDTTYCTGPQRDSIFPIDSEWLSIWFDESGHVTRWEVWSD